MPTVAWPTSLQQILDGDNFTLQMGSMVTRTENQNGLAKVRRKFTKPIDVVSGKMVIDYSLYSDLETFYRVTTDGGVNSFTMLHPIFGVTATFRFLAPPQLSHLGGAKFIVNLQLEVMP